MVPPKLKILVVCGPTGSGKGQLARQLAREFDGEIVSADSRKIYRGFDIGTAKASPQARQEQTYHLIDCCDPQEEFSAARYADLASAAIADIVAKAKLPVIVGGTGLYIRALLRGIVDTPPRDEVLRARLRQEEMDSPGILFERLRQVDPDTALRLAPSDQVRIVRALEVFALCGRTISAIQAEHAFGQERFCACQLMPAWPREDLYQRINQRVERMMGEGWLDETRQLLALGLAESPAFQTVGYRELMDHLQDKCSLDQAVAHIKQEHRRYSRRQTVWFKRVAGLELLPAPVDIADVTKRVAKFLAG